MRNRARRTTTTTPEPISSPSTKKSRKKTINKKKWMIAFSLVTIFFLVLFLNTYFNLTSGVAINPDGESLSDTYYLSGPDPYYNLRLVKETLKTGSYPYISRFNPDPLLNYPLSTSGGRPPLLNMMGISFSRVLTPFMAEDDAIGYSLQFIPALFGALLIFPVYFIGKELFNKKAGLIASLFIAIIPIHIGSGHGSAYGLFDHDSFNLFLFLTIFYFVLMSLRDKSTKKVFGFIKKSDIYALSAGLGIAALTMTWVEARYIFSVLAVYAIVQMIVDIFRNQINQQVPRSLSITLISGYILAIPILAVKANGFPIELSLYLGLGVLAFGLIYIFLKKFSIPWLLSLPSIFLIGVGAAVFLYFISDIANAIPALTPLNRMAEILYGSGIYGDKVDVTIAEAGTYSISRTVMSYGPAIYWLSWGGFVLMIWEYLKQNTRRDYLFIIVLFIINIWFAATAGRFLNDHVPFVALLAAWLVVYVISRINYPQMIKNVRNAGGGFKGLRKGVKIYHVLGVLFISVLVIMPNSLLAFDAAIPSAASQNGTSNYKIDYFGENHSGAYGSSSYKEQYWVDAFSWFAEQDSEILNPADRPGFISWWDYGFYEVAVGEHPTVADNFQSGIPPAANFHTATSEKEGVAVFIVRLIEGNAKTNDGMVSDEVVSVLDQHLGNNASQKIVLWITDPESSPSFNMPIGSEYDEDLSKTLLVGEQYPQNAFYQDIVSLLNDTLTDEEITWLYHDIQEATDYSIRYYGVEGYDAQIFNIFAFLSDKSLVLHALRTGGGTKLYNAEDDYVVVKYVGYRVNADGTPGAEGEWTTEELNQMADSERRRIVITDTKSVDKDAYFDTMFYRTYVGNIPAQFQNQIAQLPCWGMRHFTAEFLSEFPYFNTRRGAVVIAKYYEGAHINGSVIFDGAPFDCDVVVTKDISYFGTDLAVDHDRNSTDENGSFSVIAPGGEISLQLRRNPELGANAFVVKTITFNISDDPLFAPITDDQAMRKTNYMRELGNITIDPAQISGVVYQNLDNDTDTYNASMDTPIPKAEVTVIEITEFDESGQPIGTGFFDTIDTNDEGEYSLTGLVPGIYVVRATLDDFVISEDYLFAGSGNNSYDIRKPEPASIEGTTYIDANSNTLYDTGEETGEVTVQLLYTTIEGTTTTVDEFTTTSQGEYSFSNIIPGIYTLNATKLNQTTGYLDYATQQEITLTEEQTSFQNISLELAAIQLSGATSYNSEPIGGIRINVQPDDQIENNTAEETTITSSADGTYTTDLKPGSYTVSVDSTTPEGIFSYTSNLNLRKGQGIQTLDIALAKESITIQGTTQYSGIPIANITLEFLPDNSVENNTARYATTKADTFGSYRAEVRPGTYTIQIDETIQENGQNVTYRYSSSIIVDDDTPNITRDITLTKDEA